MEQLEKLLNDVQKRLVLSHASVLVDERSKEEILSQIDYILKDKKIENREAIKQRLYSELCGFSLLDALLHNDTIEEININSWDDIALTYTDGHIEKSNEHFFHPDHALDVIKKFLRASHMVIDNAAPIAYGNLGSEIRITAMKTPVVDESVGIAASIRLLRTKVTTKEFLIEQGMLSRDMADFLSLCLRYGISIVICGRTSSGKTTLMNAILNEIPNDKRIFTIESGSREINLVKHDEAGNVINNAVHTLTRSSDNKEYEVSQEDLVMAALRFDPDLICVGEMRDKEAYAAIEASSTDHTVLTTVHGSGGILAHERIAFLSQKRFQVDMDISMKMTQKAFPLTVFCHRLEEGKRRVMEICECYEEGEKMKYNVLYAFNKEKNAFEKKNPPSEALLRHLSLYGCPKEQIFWGGVDVNS